jgi:hypothetical protein
MLYMEPTMNEESVRDSEASEGAAGASGDAASPPQEKKVQFDENSLSHTSDPQMPASNNAAVHPENDSKNGKSVDQVLNSKRDNVRNALNEIKRQMEKQKAEEEARHKELADQVNKKMTDVLTHNANLVILIDNAEQLQKNVKKQTEDFTAVASKKLNEEYLNIKNASSEMLKGAESFSGTCNAINFKIKKYAILHIITIFCVAGMLCVSFIISQSSATSIKNEIRLLQNERDVLQTELAELQKGAADFAAKAGKATLTTCDGRLCVRVDNKKVYTANEKGGDGVFMIIYGY